MLLTLAPSHGGAGGMVIPGSSGGRHGECRKETSAWSHCSVTCGMGVSVRVTNDNDDCMPVEQRRLCFVRPCELNDKHMVSVSYPVLRTITSTQHYNHTTPFIFLLGTCHFIVWFWFENMCKAAHQKCIFVLDVWITVKFVHLTCITVLFCHIFFCTECSFAIFCPWNRYGVLRMQLRFFNHTTRALVFSARYYIWSNFFVSFNDSICFIYDYDSIFLKLSEP